MNEEKSPPGYVNTGIDLWGLALVNKSKFSLEKKKENMITILSRASCLQPTIKLQTAL